MHQVYYVLIDKDEAKTPDEAMSEANSALDQNAFCYADGGYFAGGKCDWYVIGGRWANLLVERHEWARTAMKEIEQMLSDNTKEGEQKISLRGTSYGNKDTETEQERLREVAEKIWGKHRPEDYPKVKYNRWKSIGFDPDTQDGAELTSPELLKYLQEYAEDVEVFTPSDYQEDLIKSFKPEDFNGDHWLVVVDYHS